MRFATTCLLMVACSLLCMAVVPSSVQAQEQILPGTELPDGIIVTPPNDASATYEAVTGNVYIGINGNFLLVGLDGAPFLLGNLNETTPLGGTAQIETGGIGFLDFSALPFGLFNIGNILPADPTIRTAAQLAEVYPDLEFRAGAAGMDAIRRRLNVIPAAIPEPGAFLSLSIVSTLALIRRRRR